MIRMSRDTKREGQNCSPESMSLPYVCLIAGVAVMVGVALAWIG